ncbi:hypothetical protein EHS39_29415 [Ensifer sp. MPMI2T]|nr:hypothetical protein EHS39_29415 [Ensifer sp. MPMI2T]
MTQSAQRVVVALSILMALSGCSFFNSKIVTVCEETLKERLRSPSGYQRIEITRYEEKMDRSEYQAYLEANEKLAERREFEMRWFDQGNKEPTLFEIYINYDAPNAYGTLIRGLVSCEYLDDDGDKSNADSYSVKVDGKTKTEWIVEQIRASNG